MKFFETSKYYTLKKTTYINLRWIAIIGQLTSVCFVYFFLDFNFDFVKSIIIIFIGTISNIYLTFVYQKTQISDRSALLFLMIDILQLSALVYLTGGVVNPFIIFLIIPSIFASSNLGLRTNLFLVLITSTLTGAKIRTMWMTPFYLFLGTLLLLIFKKNIEFKKIKKFYYIFLFFFILSPTAYLGVSLADGAKRTDYPGKEISRLVQNKWDDNFINEIKIVIGDEWSAGNLSYHLKSRPKWVGLTNSNILNNSSQFICVDNVCLGRY